MLIFCASLWVSCEEPEDNSSGNIDSNPDLNDDTFDEDLSGANLQDLFFNLENQLDYTYDYYTVDGIGYSNTIEAECSLRETDIVSFYTKVHSIGNTSITIDIETFVTRKNDQLEKNQEIKVTEGKFVYVSIDLNGKPIPIR